MPRPTRVKVRGRSWTIADQVPAKLMRDALGDCTHGTRTIRIRAGLGDRDSLDVLIHELLHAALPDLDEIAVDETATSIADILIDMGWERGS
jgi:hypothetical protein